MVRERKRHPVTDSRPVPPSRKTPVPARDGSRVLLVALLSLVIGVSAFGYSAYVKWSLSTRVITLHPAPPIFTPNSSSQSVSPSLFWGSYRPNVYFGMKSRSPRSVVTGLMWLSQSGAPSLRHICEQSDGLARYGWLMHDGVNFGSQEIRDRGFTLTTEFVKRPGGSHGGDWSWRVTGSPETSALPGQLVSIMFYVATDGQGSLTPHVEGRNQLTQITGTSEELGGFTIRFPEPQGSGGYVSYNHLSTVCPGLHLLTDVVRSSLKDRFTHPLPDGVSANSKKRRYFGLDVYLPPAPAPGAPPLPAHSQLVVHQLTLQLPFQVEVLFESDSFHDRPGPLSGKALSDLLGKHHRAMEERFRNTFRLEEKGFIPEQVAFAQAALSNMLGGMGYFYGSSLVQSQHNPEPVLYPAAPLYTAVPSRSFFPRGFLWDEGFHLLLIARWDPALAWQSLGHWLDLMNSDGWIPREQILGSEARSKVPDEFVVQRDENANPPTMFLALQQLLSTDSAAGDRLQFLQRALSRLQTWYNWFNITQAGPLPHTYRWRGRDKDSLRFLNPKTLTSGLDDYPRASHPSDDERHVDLRCWMALASEVMGDIFEHLGHDGGLYHEGHRILTDNTLLDRLHWSEKLGAYADYGNHTQNVALEWQRLQPAPGQDPRSLPPPQLVRVVKKPPKLQYVRALGYVSLFPFLLQVLSPDSPRLGRLLEQLRDTDKVWSPYGLRSLSKSSTLYLKHNTEHDAPYWRGPIWMNINYLAVRALHYYSLREGPHQERATRLYRELRENLLSNLYRQYKETGFLWEQYNDQTGHGQGCFPFTGWSSLIVLIMAEEY
ncbi:mannosyl-oligosaccharide glucosidase [Bombina bombina]|uniref:mannosyl-oligosaccharide glucosidase n=1 Tax=Bombina bombina TaxID=8345 RepID=UPI00235AD032|nr:mannosyl-oligosaccharide glucosidase [Bombina bombina]